jgi:hypothetical protein
VKITFLAIELIHQDGTSVFRYHVSPSSSDVDPATIVTYKNDLSRATIITAIDAVFFEDLKFGVTTAKFLGFALINSGSSIASSDSETSFDVDLNLVAPNLGALSSSVPLSALPSPIIPKHMEVWGMYIPPRRRQPNYFSAFCSIFKTNSPHFLVVLLPQQHVNAT